MKTEEKLRRIQIPLLYSLVTQFFGVIKQTNVRPS